MQTKEISKKEIQKFTLYRQSEVHDILKNKDRIWKLYHPQMQFLMPGVIKLEEEKVKVSEQIKAKEIVKPNAILTNIHSKEYRGYEMPYVSGHSLNDLFYQYDWNNQLDKITDLFLAISKCLQNIHKENIIAPDLFSQGNILYDEKTKTVKLIDYDGLQIKNLEAIAFCSDFEHVENFVLNNPNLYRNDLFTKEFDKLAFMVEYLLWCTSANMADNLAVNQFHPQVIPGLIRELGLNEMTELKEYLLRLFFTKECVPYPDEIIKTIHRKYYLVSHPQYPEASVFVKKR